MKTTFIGDVHGKITGMVDVALKSDAQHIVQIGDLGLGFGRHDNYTNLKPVTHFIRGNHDNPEMCRQHPSYLGEYGFNNELGIFFVGGAWSIDRAHRIEGRSWWADEQLSYAQLIEATDLYEKVLPSVVVTHDAPLDIPQEMGIRGMLNAPSIPNRTNQSLEVMLDIHKPDIWIFGHWHSDVDMIIGDTRFICLAELSSITLDL